MKDSPTLRVLSLAIVAALPAVARADFVGQPIVGTLGNGSVISNSTLGKADDNDGFDSGTHIFNIWDGGDDVFKLIWPGGDMVVSLTSLGGSDNDLFIYRPTDLNSSGDYSIVGAFDSVTILAADPGTYYINVDSTFFSEGGYEMTVTPAPGSVPLLGTGMVLAARRRRR